jgi:Protein of unknown function (DUF3224)
MQLAWLAVVAVTVFTSGTLDAAATQQKEGTMSKHVAGSFDVKVIPQKDDGISDPTVARMALDKVYHGDLDATGLGQMLAGMGTLKDSGAYVAIERVTGTLHGKKGSFAVHHVGVMNRGVQSLVITVVPDSGTDELAGITGTMTIEIKDGTHFYTFDYVLP